jgi:hypothetical protein
MGRSVYFSIAGRNPGRGRAANFQDKLSDLFRALARDDLFAIGKSDDGIGRILDELDELRIQVNRLTVQTRNSYHGRLAFRPGLEVIVPASLYRHTAAKP